MKGKLCQVQFSKKVLVKTWNGAYKTGNSELTSNFLFLAKFTLFSLRYDFSLHYNKKTVGKLIYRVYIDF